MAETISPRFGLRRYSADTDTFSRAEYDANTAQVETLGAIDKQGALGSRPAAGVVGTYYQDTAAGGALYRDDGSAWRVVGARTIDAVAASSGTGTVPLTAAGITSQTADLFQASVAASVKARIKADGTFSGFKLETESAAITGTVAATVPLNVKGAAAQSGDMFQLQTNGGGNLFKVASSGAVQSAFFVSGSGQGVIGKASASNALNMNKFTGVPSFEVASTGGGAGGTFTDFMYLHHDAADATAVLRRLGFLIKIGAETVGDAGRTGGLYIESSAANADNPTLVLMRADATAMSFPPSPGLANVNQSLSVTGFVQPNPTGTAHYEVANGRIGSHDTNAMYIRAGGAAGFYFYSGGGHSATPGDPNGGTTLATLLKSSSEGLFTTSRGYFTGAGGSADPASANPHLQAGVSNSFKLLMTHDRIQAANNTATSPIFINPHGGQVNIGASGSLVAISGRPTIDGKRIFIQATSPTATNVGDIWIDI